MNYIDLNPIVEVEGSDDDDISNSPMLRLRASVVDQQESNESLSILFHQESIKAQKDVARQDNPHRFKQGNIEFFPNIKGIEFEYTKILTFDTQNRRSSRRASSMLKSSTNDILKSETSASEMEFNRHNLEEEQHSQTIESVEKFFSKGTLKRTKTLNANENLETLKSIVNGKFSSSDEMLRKFSLPEAMLRFVVGSFYEIDFSSKKKDSQLIDLALSALDNADMKYEQKKILKCDLVDDLDKLEGFLKETQKEAVLIDEEIKYRTKEWMENRILLENRAKLVKHKIYSALNTKEKIEFSLNEKIEKYMKIVSEKAEATEVWLMNNEDLRGKLYSLETWRKSLETDSNLLQTTLSSIIEEKKKYKLLKKKIKICMESLYEILDYFSGERIDSNIIYEFSSIISNIKSEISQAILAENEFKDHAVTDPKSIMPYYRASDTGYL